MGTVDGLLRNSDGCQEDDTSRNRMKGRKVLPYLLRPMVKGDVSQVAAIEREAFAALWPAPSLNRELNNPVARYLVVLRIEPKHGGNQEPLPLPKKLSWYARIGEVLRRLVPSEWFVVPTPQCIAGFVGTWYAADEAHVVAVAVRTAYQGRGLGELLVIGAVELAMARGARVVTLEVRVSNLPAQRLYEKYGFRHVGVRKKYYTDNNEDAAIMTTDPIGTTTYQELFGGLVEQFRRKRGMSSRTLY